MDSSINLSNVCDVYHKNVINVNIFVWIVLIKYILNINIYLFNTKNH